MRIEENYKSGYAALIGRPNVGKSTLLNRLVSVKIVVMVIPPKLCRRGRGRLRRPSDDRDHRPPCVCHVRRRRRN